MSHNLQDLNFTQVRTLIEHKKYITSQVKRLIHQDSLEEAGQLLLKCHPVDIAELIVGTNDHTRKIILELIDPHFDPRILLNLNDELILIVANLLGKQNFVTKFARLTITEALHILQPLPHSFQEEVLNILAKIDSAKYKILAETLAYAPDMAARWMNKNIVAVPAYWTVENAFHYLANQTNLENDFTELFVVNPKFEPTGCVKVAKLLTAPKDTPLRELAEPNIIIVKVNNKVDDVMYLFKQYGLSSVPVVDNDNRIVGRISIDNIVGIIEQEAEEDFMKLSGLHKIDVQLFASLKTCLERCPWLFVNLITSFLTSLVIREFEATLHKLILVASLMPMVASLGGNAGTQTLAVTVRMLNNHSNHSFAASRIIFKEVFTCILNGLTISLVGCIMVYYISHNFVMSCIFGAAIILNLTFAGFAGAVIPILLTKLKLDPALASGVFLTALTDLMGFFAFLSLASFMI